MTRENTFAVAVSTLVATRCSSPSAAGSSAPWTGVRPRPLRRPADGRLFAERLRDQVDLESLEHDLAATVDGTLRPTSLAVWLRTGASEP